MTGTPRPAPTNPARESAATGGLADRLAGSLDSAPGGHSGLWRPLLELLSTGEPVTVGQLAAASGKPEDEVRQALATMTDTEYDDNGRIVGSGLTHNPTRHRFETGGRTLYTWCALDTLVFPAVLGQPAHVTSTCRSTGTPVRLTVEPEEVSSLEPATAMVSLVTPDGPKSLRASFCERSHFFVTPEASQDWLDHHFGGTVLPVAEAHELGLPLAQRFFAHSVDPGCC